MTIPWTKCSERMPPDDVELIIEIDGILFHTYSVGSCVIRNINRHIATAKWTPYTEEAWKELSE